MSQADQSADLPVNIPTFEQTLLHSLSQKLFTVAATGLLSYGVIAPDQTSQFVSLGVSVAMFAAGMAWTYIRSKLDHARLLAAMSSSTDIAMAAIDAQTLKPVQKP